MRRGLLVSDLITAQHRGLHVLLDACSHRGATRAARAAFANALSAHISVEEELVYVHLGSPTQDQYVDEHAVLRYAADRFVSARGQNGVMTARARVVRDLLVHHFDREERVQLAAIEASLGARTSRALARSVEARLRELAGAPTK